MSWANPWEGAFVSIGDTLSPEQLATIQELDLMWQPDQKPASKLSEFEELKEDVNVEWLADTLSSPQYSPMTSGSRGTVHAGEKFLLAARDVGTHTSRQWTEHMALLKYKREAFRVLRAAGWVQRQDVTEIFSGMYEKELRAVATPPIQSSMVEVYGGGFEMIAKIIRDTKPIRDAHLRSKKLPKFPSGSLIKTQSMLAAKDRRNPNAGESNVEGNIRPEQMLCELVLEHLPIDIRPIVYFPQTIKGPFTGDRLFAIDLLEDEAADLEADLEALSSESKEWRQKQNIADRVAVVSTASARSFQFTFDGLQDETDDSYRPGQMPKDEDEILGRVAVKGISQLELKPRSVFTWQQSVSLLTGMLELLKEGEQQGISVGYDGLTWSLEWRHPHVTGANAANGHKLAQIIGEMIACNLSTTMLTCLEWFLIIRRNCEPHNDAKELAFAISPAMTASNPVLPHFKAMTSLALLPQHPDEVAPVHERRSQPLHRLNHPPTDSAPRPRSSNQQCS